MSVRVALTNHDLYCKWWCNFCREMTSIHGNAQWKINPALAVFNGRDSPGGFIEFDTEEDVTAFMLKWS